MTYLEKLTHIIEIALIEDHSLKDATSNCTLDDDYKVDFTINARQNIILSGIDCISICFKKLKNSHKFANSTISYQIHAKDGDFIGEGKSILTGNGSAKLIFAAERVILNCLQHMSGISTLTHQFINTLGDDNIKILDTRKTTIGLREIEKYAVRYGGGFNHRNDLSDAILIKDNHIAANSDIATTVTKAINNNVDNLEIIVECDNLDQVKTISDLAIDRIMLDNMNPQQIAQAAFIIDNKVKIEISGGVNLDNISSFRGLDVDCISVGAITHSAKAVDIGLDIL